MDPISKCVTFTYENRTLDIVYNLVDERMQFKSCILDKKKGFSFKNIWVNEQPAKYFRQFTSARISQSDISHFKLNEDRIHLYFKNSNEIQIEVIDETNLDKTKNIIQIKINLVELEVKGIKKILNLTSDKSLFDNSRKDLLPYWLTLKECCIKANGKLLIKNHVFSKDDRLDDCSLDCSEEEMLNDIKVNKKAIDSDFDSNIPEIKLPKFKYASFSHGLTLMGKCQDSNCETFGREACIEKGLGEFDINTVCKDSVCPCCKGKLLNSNIGRIFLNDCVYTITATSKDEKTYMGTLKVGETYRYNKSVGRNDSMTLFSSFSEVALKWKNFTITVEKSPVKNPAFFTGPHWVIGGSIILVAAYVFYNMNKNTK